MVNRERKRDWTSATDEAWYEDFRANGSSAGKSAPGHYGVYGRTGPVHHIIDEAHPGYAKMRKRGRVIMGDVSKSSRTRECGMASYKVKNADGSYVIVQGDVMAFIDPSIGNAESSRVSGDVAIAKDVTLVKAFAKMNESSLLVGEMLKDASQTASMLKKPMGSALDLINNMLKSRKKLLSKGLTATKASANAWLEYRYGWRPILSDMGTMIEKFYTGNPGMPQRLVARSGATFGGNSNYRLISTGIPRALGYEGTVASSYEASVNSGVIYSLASYSTIQKYEQVMGFRPRDITATAWECIPYSFVADWFINIGDWIQASTPNPMVTVISNWTTVTFKDEISFGGFVPTCGAGQTVSGNLGYSKITTTGFNRTCNRPLPTLPSLKKKPLSMNQTLDALSLSLGKITNALGKLKH